LIVKDIYYSWTFSTLTLKLRTTILPELVVISHLTLYMVPAVPPVMFTVLVVAVVEVALPPMAVEVVMPLASV
jgi:hypothetical protein